jgi:hypothetical protein
MANIDMLEQNLLILREYAEQSVQLRNEMSDFIDDIKEKLEKTISSLNDEIYKSKIINSRINSRIEGLNNIVAEIQGFQDQSTTLDELKTKLSGLNDYDMINDFISISSREGDEGSRGGSKKKRGGYLAKFPSKNLKRYTKRSKIARSKSTRSSRSSRRSSY